MITDYFHYIFSAIVAFIFWLIKKLFDQILNEIKESRKDNRINREKITRNTTVIDELPCRNDNRPTPCHYLD